MTAAHRRPAALWVGITLALVTLVIASLAIGAVPLAPSAVLDALAGRGDPLAMTIVRDLRLPRVALAILVGCALGSSGAALQGTLRNALAEPYLLGVSGGAAVGAVVAMTFGITGIATVPLAAFGGAIAAVILVLALARAAGGARDPRTLLMAGVIIGAFANAVILIVLADESPDKVRGAMWWMAGSLGDASWLRVSWLAAYVAVGVSLLVLRGRLLDVLALGDESAAALGADVAGTTQQVFLVSALLAAASVSAAGLVGFVGLVVPNIVRAFGIVRHRALIVGAALGGAVLMLIADLVARTVRAPVELPLGAITALIGVPVFLLRLRRVQ
ncbi:MAG TPA: iron ABC transporter permease [Gemmatimonadaceae bacterium]|nr:iron ABC transporter permease [Gemmatimonadaceae bacterium]